MLKGKSVYLICFNSMSVFFYVFTKKEDTYLCEYQSDTFYNGIGKGFFIAPSEIEKIISDLLKGYTDKTGKNNKNIHEVTIVLPQTLYKIKPALRRIAVSESVSAEDLEKIKNIPVVFPEDFIQKEELFGGYRCNDAEPFMDNVIGKESTELQKFSVYVCLNAKAQELFDNISKNLHITFSFIAPMVPICSQLKREGCPDGIVLSMNEFTCDICSFNGGIPLSVLSLPYGTDSFVMHLCKILSLEKQFPVAKELMMHINFGLPIKRGNYSVFLDKKYDFAVEDVNKPLMDFCEHFAKEVQSCTRGLLLNETAPIFIVGSFLQKVHGFCEIISEKTNLPCYSIMPSSSSWTEPEDFLVTAITEEL